MGFITRPVFDRTVHCVPFPEWRGRALAVGNYWQAGRKIRGHDSTLVRERSNGSVRDGRY